jgi:hypothetical protein
MSRLLSIQDLMPGVVSLSRTWHPHLAHSFERYASARTHAWRARKVGAQTEPHWLLVPQWLMEQSGRKGTGDRKFLRDCLLGQFCAFLAVKLHDDLFDGHISDRSLIYAADHLLVSAHRAFRPHFPTASPFWAFFDLSIRRTINAIIDWDHSQLHGFGPVSLVKEITSAGYAVCNIATYAVCLRLRKPQLYRALLPCTDELAFVGQLLDDLEDMQADYLRGRLNYAARFLLRRRISGRTEIAQRLAMAILVDGTGGKFFRLLEKHLRRASDIALTVGMPELVRYTTEHLEGLESADMLLHRKRVQLVFGK